MLRERRDRKFRLDDDPERALRAAHECREIDRPGCTVEGPRQRVARERPRELRPALAQGLRDLVAIERFAHRREQPRLRPPRGDRGVGLGPLEAPRLDHVAAGQHGAKPPHVIARLAVDA